MRIMTTLLILALMAAIGQAQVGAPRVEVRLLADHSAVAAGESFDVGVLLEIEPQWHVYWKYPGDAGLPTSVQWSLPEGFEVSELLWPVPMQFMQEGDILGYGYEDQVMLLAKVTPPAGYSGDAQISAAVRWLACKETCVPGRATASTTVKIGASNPVQANRETFAQWLRRLPGQGSEVNVTREGMTYTLRVAGAPADAEIKVFVAPPDGAEVRRIEQEGDRVRVEFTRMVGATIEGHAEVVMAGRDFRYRVLLPFD
jgi:DsbC/DsbD-like thiol-disulfide interchange protein